MRLAIVILFFALTATAATVTNVTVGSGGGYHYTSLSAAENGEDNNPDLVTRDTILVFQCYGFTDITGMIIDGFTTDSTRYVIITNMVPHAGVWSASSYSLSCSNATALDVRDDYVSIYGLQIETGFTNATYICINTISLAAANSIHIERCMFRTNGIAGVSVWGVNVNDTDAILRVDNCVSGKMGTANGIGFRCNAAVSATFLNCISTGGADAAMYRSYVREGGSMFTTNCIAQDNGSDGFNGTILGDYNVSDRASDAPGSNSQTGEVAFVDEANWDFHLASNDTVAMGNGQDLSAFFTTDIDGQTRTGAWDIGADEYVAPAATGTADDLSWLLMDRQ